MNFNPEQPQIPTPEQAPMSGVNLDRDLPFESGLEYNPDYFYRMIGEEGYNDFLETGEFRPAPDTKQDYEKVYYYKGHPLARYARGVEDVYFLEVDPDGEELFSDGNKYKHSLRNINKGDRVRVYRVSGSETEIVFSNFD